MTIAPKNVRTFEKHITIDTTIDQLIDFHKKPSTMPRLSPPPIFVQIIRDERKSLKEGELEFTLWFGPFPIHWIAQHEPGPTEHSFADLMVKGPLAYWRHEHIFDNENGKTTLIDRITIAHKSGIRGLVTRLIFDGIPLKMLFFYRHLRTKLALQGE